MMSTTTTHLSAGASAMRLPSIDLHQQDVGERGNLYMGLCGWCRCRTQVMKKWAVFQQLLTYVPCPGDMFDGLQLRCSTTMMVMMATITDGWATTMIMDQGTITLNVSEDTEHWLVTAGLTLLNFCFHVQFPHFTCPRCVTAGEPTHYKHAHKARDVGFKLLSV